MRTLSILLLLTSFAAQAKEVTGVFDIWAPEAGEENYLVLATNREIYEVAATDKELVSKIYEAKMAQAFVAISFFKSTVSESILSNRKQIKNIDLKSTFYAPMSDSKEATFGNKYATTMDNYEPTVVSSMQRANELFSSMRTDSRRRSQCYNRAHVWTYELYKRYRLNSNKVWIFFTRKYIGQYKWKWWFHVSPSVTVAGQDQEIVLDRKFRRGASTLTDWKNEFMKNKANCPMIDKYGQYSSDQYSEYCYILKSSMYYWQPYNIENLEKGSGEVPNGTWVEYQLDRAYKNGISIFHGGVDAGEIY